MVTIYFLTSPGAGTTYEVFVPEGITWSELATLYSGKTLFGDYSLSVSEYYVVVDNGGGKFGREALTNNTGTYVLPSSQIVGGNTYYGDGGEAL